MQQIRADGWWHVVFQWLVHSSDDSVVKCAQSAPGALSFRAVHYGTLAVSPRIHSYFYVRMGKMSLREAWVRGHPAQSDSKTYHHRYPCSAQP